MANIGYIRVSSNKQTLEHQRFEIENFALKNNIKIDTWVEEKISSRKALKNRKLGELLDNLQENDVLISCEISRLGRSLLEVMRILETCLNKNCQVWTLKENYRLGNDIQSKVLAFAFGLAAEIERQLISERTKSSLANIKAQGKKLGRPFNAKTKKLKLAKTKNRYRSCWRKEYQNQKLQNYSALSERLYTDIYSDCRHKPKSHLNNPRQANFLFACNL